MIKTLTLRRFYLLSTLTIQNFSPKTPLQTLTRTQTPISVAHHVDAPQKNVIKFNVDAQFDASTGIGCNEIIGRDYKGTLVTGACSN